MMNPFYLIGCSFLNELDQQQRNWRVKELIFHYGTSLKIITQICEVALHEPYYEYQVDFWVSLFEMS